MWPSNGQQHWSTTPSDPSDPVGAGATESGQDPISLGYYPYQMQQQVMQQQMQTEMMQQMQNQMMPMQQQHQMQAQAFCYPSAVEMNPNSFPVHGVPPPPPPPPPSMLPPPPPPDQQKFYCEICKIACPNEYSLRQHVTGDRHRKQEANQLARARGEQSTFKCDLCNVTCRTERQLKQHLNGEKHRKKKANVAAGGSTTKFCKVCNVTCPDAFAYDQHINGEKHRKRVKAGKSVSDHEVKEHKRHVAAAARSGNGNSTAGPEGSGQNDTSTKKTSHDSEQQTPMQQVYCEVCKISCPNEFSYQQHVNGEKHRRLLANPLPGMYHCALCNVNPSTEVAYRAHVNGKKHMKRVAAMGVAGSALANPSAARDASTARSLPQISISQNDVCTPAPPSLPPPPVVAEKEEREKKAMRPPAGWSGAEDDESEEEGEIDEEKEDIENLYDDFEETKCSPGVDLQEPSLGGGGEKDEDDGGGEDGGDEDSDVDDMFGVEENSDQKGGGQESDNSKTSESGQSTHQPQESFTDEVDEPIPNIHEADPTPQDESSKQSDSNNQGVDVDADEAFGGNGGEAARENEGGTCPESESSRHVHHRQKIAEAENRDQSQDKHRESDIDEMEMFGDEDEIGQVSPSIKTAHEPMQNTQEAPDINVVGTSDMPEVSPNDGGGEESNIRVSVERKSEQPTMLDSGLGFVLDYSPDSPINGSGGDVGRPRQDQNKIAHTGRETGGGLDHGNDTQSDASIDQARQEKEVGECFVLDYSPDTPIGNTAGNDDKPHQDLEFNQNQILQNQQENEVDNDMFGNSSDEDGGNAEGSATPTTLRSRGITPARSHKVAFHLKPSDCQHPPLGSAKKPKGGVKGGILKRKNAEAWNGSAGEAHVPTHFQAMPINSAAIAKGPMTAADALAAARSRASMPTQQHPAKRARTSTQQSKPVNIACSATQGEDLKRSYYPPVHPDKYWSELRSWDFVRALNDAMKNSNLSKKTAKRTLGESNCESANDKNGDERGSVKTSPLPDAFESVSQYKALWAPLLINEAKAQLLSEVVAAQSSASSSWLQRGQLATGAAAKVELSRTARDHSSPNESANSLEPTVVVHIRPSSRGAGIGKTIAKNDLILFVHQPPTVERALRGKAFESKDELCSTKLQNLPQGRLGFVGHALNHRSRSLDGLLVRVSQKHWCQFASLDELFVLRIGSNITALREFNALSRTDTIPLTKYLLDGNTCGKKEKETPQNMEHESSNQGSKEAPTKFDPLAVGGNTLPVGFRIFIKSKMNPSQLHAITASASEYGDGGFTLIKGPPGTGKSTTLCSILNALHLRQYQEYYSAIEKTVIESNASSHYEELAALNKAAEVKPRILVCAPSNAGIDNVIIKIMSDRFVDGQGAKYSPSIVRVGAGISNAKVNSVGLQQTVDSIIAQGSDVVKLENTIATGRKNLTRIQNEIHKLRIRIKAMVECCPYEISSDWEIRIDEGSFESGKVLFVNHKTRTTTYDIPPKVRPNERPGIISKMPHYVSLLKSLTKYVERHNNETSSLEKYIILQNDYNARAEAGGDLDDSVSSLLETHVLDSTHIVLTTLGSAGGRAVESANKFKVVVIDEAAQSAEPSTLVALQLGSCHAILVGDPQQLPATIFSVSGRSTKYDRSLFQRLEESGHGVHLLNTQYRMNPVISEFPRHIFYEGMLLDGPNVQEPDFGGSLKSMIRSKFPYVQPFNIFDLDSKEERINGTSLSNKNEAQLVLQLYRTLDGETDGLVAKTRVAVITPYSQQSSLLKRLFEERYGASYQSRVEISTVDAFQGREAGIVIYSCVRAGGRGSGIGFLSDVQRMNVALTRAKHFLFVIARRRSIMVNPYWRKLVGYARSKSAIIHVPIDAKQQKLKPQTVRSSLIKRTSGKKVSFGGVSERIYEVDSKANNGEEEEDLFPDLTKLTPMHIASTQGDILSDSECSA